MGIVAASGHSYAEAVTGHSGHRNVMNLPASGVRSLEFKTEEWDLL